MSEGDNLISFYNAVNYTTLSDIEILDFLPQVYSRFPLNNRAVLAVVHVNCKQ